MLATFSIAFGLLGLLAGGECLVRGAVSLARTLGVPPVIVGLTIVGFGTSTPELVTSLQAALAGSEGIAVGNVVGSNISNVLLILGIAAAFSPIAVNPALLRRDGAVMLLASLMCLACVLLGEISRPIAGGLVATLMAYLIYTIRSEVTATKTLAAQRQLGPAMQPPDDHKGNFRAIVVLLAGLLLTILGARLLVNGAVTVAQLVGLSEAVIGLTVVAVGTSLPELVSTVIAVRKEQTDLAVGNIIGSNIFNILGILGVTAMVRPITMPEQIISFDIWVMLLAAVLLLLLARSHRRLDRGEGLAMLLGYIAYVCWLILPLAGH